MRGNPAGILMIGVGVVLLNLAYSGRGVAVWEAITKGKSDTATPATDTPKDDPAKDDDTTEDAVKSAGKSASDASQTTPQGSGQGGDAGRCAECGCAGCNGSHLWGIVADGTWAVRR